MNNKIYLIANWKMQLLDSEAVSLTKDILENLPRRDPAHSAGQATSASECEIILCPSFTALSKVNDIIKESKLSNVNGQLSLGAQNVFYHEQGQYTGEISPLQLKELGVKYIIIGHSERREYLKETDENINRKVNICLDNELIPIICIGETLPEKQDGQTDLTIIRQITKTLEDVQLKNDQKLILTYEPVWAISPAPPAEPADAKSAAQMIKHLLLDFFEPEIIKNNISIIYGGSVDAENIKDFIHPELLDGVLVGGASLSAEKFIPLIHRLSS